MKLLLGYGQTPLAESFLSFSETPNPFSLGDVGHLVAIQISKPLFSGVPPL